MILSGATIPGQSGPGNDGNEGVLSISPSSSVTGASPSDCFVSLSRHLWKGCLNHLQLCSRQILQPQQTGLNLSFMKKDNILV